MCAHTLSSARVRNPTESKGRPTGIQGASALTLKPVWLRRRRAETASTHQGQEKSEQQETLRPCFQKDLWSILQACLCSRGLCTLPLPSHQPS